MRGRAPDGLVRSGPCYPTGLDQISGLARAKLRRVSVAAETHVIKTRA